jgi:hypothetical protein
MRAPQHNRGRSAREKGYILALSALLLIPMLAFTGFATDVGSWYARASRMQRAADSAALAGVVQMPNFDSGSTNATSVALGTAARNGFTDGVNGIEVNVFEVGPRQIRVEIIDSNVEVYFTSIFFDEIDLTRDATSEYLQSLPMGSPENYLGNDPLRSPVPSPYPNYWLNVGSNNMQKVQGDRYTNGNCTGNAVDPTLTSGCTTAANTGANTDYSPDGYYYAVEVESVTAGQPLRIQVFDPAWTNVGSNCASNLPDGTQRTNLANLAETTMNDANTRYVPGDGIFCSGDSDPGGSIPGTPGANQGPQNASFIVRSPDLTAFDNTDNPVITGCSRTFTGRNINATGVYDRLRESTAYNEASEQGYEAVGFRTHFRQWFTLCTIPAGSVEVGTYYIQVRTNGSVSALPDSAVNEDTANDRGGHNRFSLRAGYGASGTPTGTNVNTFAAGRLPIYVNTPGGTTEFFLARIDERYQGEVLSLDFFDIGDTTSGSITFLVLPPNEATTTAGNFDAFTGCSISRDGTPGQPTSGSVVGCGVTGMNAGNYQGRRVNVQIPIPSTYNCDEADTGGIPGCWVKVRLTMVNAAPTDQTTWTASVLGEPVRLVE